MSSWHKSRNRNREKKIKSKENIRGRRAFILVSSQVSNVKNELGYTNVLENSFVNLFGAKFII